MDKDFLKKFSDMVPEKLKNELKDIYNQIVTPAPAPSPSPAPVQLQEAKLKDGTAIKYDTPTLAVGSTITMITPDGEKPATEGELVLEDGSTVKVGADGKVTEIIPAAAMPDMAPQMAQMRQEFESKFKSFADAQAFSALQNKCDAQEKEIKTVKEQFGKFLEVFGEILETPSADPIEQPKNKFKDDKNKKREEALNKFINRK
jgi:hypothetical protein